MVLHSNAVLVGVVELLLAKDRKKIQRTIEKTILKYMKKFSQSGGGIEKSASGSSGAGADLTGAGIEAMDVTDVIHCALDILKSVIAIDSVCMVGTFAYVALAADPSDECVAHAFAVAEKASFPGKEYERTKTARGAKSEKSVHAHGYMTDSGERTRQEKKKRELSAAASLSARGKKGHDCKEPGRCMMSIERSRMLGKNDRSSSDDALQHRYHIGHSGDSSLGLGGSGGGGGGADQTPRQRKNSIGKKDTMGKTGSKKPEVGSLVGQHFSAEVHKHQSELHNRIREALLVRKNESDVEAILNQKVSTPRIIIIGVVYLFKL